MENFFWKQALVRSSVQPIEYVLEILEKDDESWLDKLRKDAYFMNSIFLASPSLYEKFITIREISKNHKDYLSLKNSLLKYAKRISTRSTPFGLFSGCQLTEIKDGEIIKVGELEEFSFHTSLDMDVSVLMASQLAQDPIIQKFLVYFPNTSIYRTGSTHRLVSYSTSGRRNRKYQLISIYDEVEMAHILEFCKNGKTHVELKGFLLTKGYPEDDVSMYLKELIENQVLISELEPSSLGEDFEFQILNTLENIVLRCNAESEKSYLEEKVNLLKNVVESYPKNISEILKKQNFLKEKEKKIFSLLNKLGSCPEGGNLLQIDLHTQIDQSGFPPNLIEKIEQILPVIQKFRRTDPNPTQGRLANFKKAFIERYDSKAVPLTEVLDVEVGIGYGVKLKNDSGDNHPLIDNLPRNLAMKNTEEIIWNERIDSFWIELIKESINDGSEKIQLSELDLKQFQERPLDYSASFVVKTAILKKKQEDYLHVEFFGGHTATIWVGRFCNGNQKIRELYNKITNHEKSEFVDFDVAEIDHLPQAKLGNVVLRPNNRDKIISYVVQDKTQNNEKKEKNIHLSDLLVMVDNDTVFIKSKSSNRFVIPYYSNAFNIGLSDNLPVFQFLADVSREYTHSSGSIDLSHLHRIYDYIPRVEYENIILRRATWKIKSEIFRDLRSLNTIPLLDKFQEICLEFKIPEYFVFKKGDNELLVKRNHSDSVRAFLSEISRTGNILLTEFLMSEFESGVKDKNGKNFNNEILLFAGSKKGKKFIPSRRTNFNNNRIKEEFLPGSEWIYYKIYVGYKSADPILKLLRQFFKRNKKSLKVQKWFFIRYYDPDFHIRLRIRVHEKESVALAFMSLGEFFQEIQEEHKFGKVVVDTYIRELMRYGYELIDDFEEIFHFDSILCIDIIEFFHNSNKFNSADLWIGGLVVMDFYCNLFLNDDNEILKFLETSKDRYALEFGANLATKKEINRRYSENRKILTSIFFETGETDILKVINNRRKVFEPLVDKIVEHHPEDLKYYLSSVIHMTVNRMFRKNQRLYEYLLFDFLHKIRTTKKHLRARKHLPGI